MKKKYILIVIFFFIFNRKVNANKAEHPITLIGDWLQILLPLSSFIVSAVDSPKSMLEFTMHFAMSNFTTFGVKKLTNLDRPNGSRHSFPSGHTVSAFSGASYIRVKYGFKYAIAPYLLASFVGYSRIYADKHYLRDVVASIVLSELTAMWLVKAKVNTDVRQLNFIVNPSRQEFGFNFNYKF